MIQRFFCRFGAVFEPFSHLFGKWNQIFKLSNYYNVLIFILYSFTRFPRPTCQFIRVQTLISPKLNKKVEGFEVEKKRNALDQVFSVTHWQG